jgi:hypothetical protein
MEVQRENDMEFDSDEIYDKAYEIYKRMSKDKI